MTTTSNTATCPICSRSFKVRKNGRIARHGHAQVGLGGRREQLFLECLGSDANAADLHGDAVRRLEDCLESPYLDEAQLAYCRATLARLAGPEATEAEEAAKAAAKAEADAAYRAAKERTKALRAQLIEAMRQEEEALAAYQAAE